MHPSHDGSLNNSSFIIACSFDFFYSDDLNSLMDLYSFHASVRLDERYVHLIRRVRARSQKTSLKRRPIIHATPWHSTACATFFYCVRHSDVRTVFHKKLIHIQNANFFVYMKILRGCLQPAELAQGKALLSDLSDQFGVRDWLFPFFSVCLEVLCECRVKAGYYHFRTRRVPSS
jgi:hypothetical protein